MDGGQTAVNKEAIKQFAEKVYADMAGAMATGMAYVGVKTALFRAMAGKGPMRADSVAEISGLQPRGRTVPVCTRGFADSSKGG